MKATGQFAVAAVVGLSLIAFCLWAAPVQAAYTPVGTQIKNKATSTYEDINANTYNAASNELIVTVASIFVVDIACTPVDYATPNLMVYMGCTVTNTGNDKNTFTLTPAATNGWDSAVLYDADGNGSYTTGELATATTGELAALGTYKVLLGVKMPQSVGDSTTTSASLTITGTGAGAGATATYTKTVTGQKPVVSLLKKVRNVTAGVAEFADINVTAKPTEVLEYQVRVANDGSSKANSIVLTDVLDTHVAYLAGKLYAGSNDTGGNKLGNLLKTEGGSDPNCLDDVCATASYNGTNTVTFRIGKGATEAAGGSLDPGKVVYVYYQVTVQ
jgi:uncharacterized repeat protein (TIGR01451 family)